jgi:hypothetical protein
MNDRFGSWVRRVLIAGFVGVSAGAAPGGEDRLEPASIAVAPRAPLFAMPDDEPDSPLTVAGPDFSITLGALLQYRYTASWAPGNTDSEPSVGFQFRRLRPILRASGAEGKLGLLVQTEAGGNMRLRALDAWASYQITDELRFRFGRFNLQYDREISTPAAYLLAADYSVLGNTLNTDAASRVEGFDFRYQTRRHRLTLTFSEGLGVSGTAFGDARSDWGVTGRYETLLIGDSFADQLQLTAPRGTPRSLMLGFAAHQQHLRGLGERFNATADLTYKHDGFIGLVSLGAQVSEDRNGSMFGEPEHDWGMVVASGYHFTEQFEPFARMELGTTSGREHPELALVTTGFNYYIYGQALKFVTDVSVAFNGIGPAFDRGVDGFMQTSDGDHRFVWRAQLQMLF